jgi:hypothetical protein
MHFSTHNVNKSNRCLSNREKTFSAYATQFTRPFLKVLNPLKREQQTRLKFVS